MEFASASKSNVDKQSANRSSLAIMPYICNGDFEKLCTSEILCRSPLGVTSVADGNHRMNHAQNVLSSSLNHRNDVSYEIASDINGSFLNSMESTLPFDGYTGSECQQQSRRNSYTEICSTEDCKKQNHSEIEKRRRDKMNHYIVELSHMIPMCGAMPRKLDKLTVLRMAVQHIKALKNSLENYSAGVQEKPSFLSDDILMDLISKISDGFLFVVSCDGAKILYVSHSVSQVLNYSQDDLIAQNWFNFLHHKDIAKVKEQLSSSDLFPKETLIDARTMLPIKTRLPPKTEWKRCPGARRSFFCRMRYKSDTKEESEKVNRVHKKRKSNNSEKKYCVLHCVGYLTVLCPERMNEENEVESDSEQPMNCLVAVGRTLINFTPPTETNIESRSLEFVSRHSKDGKFLFVDHRATLILGFLQQELLGTTFSEYCHPEDTNSVLEFMKSMFQLNSANPVTKQCRFRMKSGCYITLQSSWKIINNPWTKDFEFFIVKNSIIPNFEAVDPKLRFPTKNNISMAPLNGNISERKNFNRIETNADKKKVDTESVILNELHWNHNELKNVDFGDQNHLPTIISVPENFVDEKKASNLIQKISCEQVEEREVFSTNSVGNKNEQSFVDTTTAEDNDHIINHFWSNLSNLTSINDSSSTNSIASTTYSASASSSSNQDLLLDYNSLEKSVDSCKSLPVSLNSSEDTDESTIALIKSLLESDADFTTVDFN